MGDGQTEREIQAAIIREFGRLPWMRLWRNSVGVGLTPDGERTIRFGLPGSADLQGVISPAGTFLAIECKSARGRPTALQRAYGRMVERMGGIYVLARSVEDVRRALKQRGIGE